MRAVVLLLWLSFLTLSSPALAQELEQHGSSSRTLALGQAGVSAGEEPPTLWQNPALLPRTTSYFYLGFGLRDPRRSLLKTTLVNQPDEARDLAGVLLQPAAALAWPLIKQWLWLGIGYHVGLNTHSAYPAPSLTQDPETPNRYQGTALSMTQHLIHLGLAGHQKGLSIGAALELEHLRVRCARSLWAGFADDQAHLEDPKLDVEARFEGQNSLSVSGLLGVAFQATTWLSFGAAVGLPHTTSLRGTISLTPAAQAPSGYSALGTTSGTGEIELPLPLRLQGGVAIGPPRWRLLLEGRMVRWATAAALKAQAHDATIILTRAEENVIYPLERLDLGLSLQNQLSLHTAVELQPLTGFLTVRSAYAYYRGATRPEAPSVLLLDLNRHVWSMGLEATRAWISVGLAFSYSFTATLTTRGNEAQLVNPLDPLITTVIGQGDYQTSSMQVQLDARMGW